MVVQKPDVDSFTQFATANEAKLRHALIATCGGEVGREAAVEALAYGWEHWVVTSSLPLLALHERDAGAMLSSV